MFENIPVRLTRKSMLDIIKGNPKHENMEWEYTPNHKSGDIIQIIWPHALTIISAPHEQGYEEEMPSMDLELIRISNEPPTKEQIENNTQNETITNKHKDTK